MCRIEFLLPVLALAACSDPRTRSAGAGSEPERLEVTLSPDDRAWIEGLLDRKGGLRSPVDVAEPVPVLAAPALAESAAWRVPADPKMRLVDDGPVALATYNGGGKMYEGSQIESEGGWERHGPWQAWHADGQLWEAGTYFEGEEHGLWEWWYENGHPQARGEYDQGQRVGAWVYFHENGTVMARGAYDHDRPIGSWSVLDENGVLVSETDHETVVK